MTAGSNIITAAHSDEVKVQRELLKSHDRR
jgi:hypothetical protein